MIVTLLFLFIPISGIASFFLKDKNAVRKDFMNSLSIANVLLLFSPMIKAYFDTPSGESMWNENSGGGAVLWLYIFIFPICLIAQIALLSLKIIFHIKSK